MSKKFWTIYLLSAVYCLLFIGQNFCFAKYTIDDAEGFLETANQGAGVEQTDIYTISARIVQVGLGLVSLTFFVLIFYAGYRWLLARGNEEQTKKALDTIKASIIGLVIVVGAYALTNFVISRMFDKSPGKAPTQEKIADTTKIIGKLGCCLDEYEAEGGFWDAGNVHHWLWSVNLDKGACEEQGLTCAEGDQICGSANWEFLEGVVDKIACEELAQTKATN